MWETDEKAVQQAKPHLEALMTKLLKMPIEMLLPPGYTNLEAMQRIKKTRAVSFNNKPQTIDDFIRMGVVIIGSPATVVEKLAEYEEKAGFGTVLTKTQFGTMPHQMAMENIAAIASEVIPKFK